MTTEHDTTVTVEESVSASVPPDTQSSPTSSKMPDNETSGSRSSNRIRSFWIQAEKKTIIFIILAVIAISLYFIVNLGTITGILQRIFAICKPIIIGAVIAYLCNPILKFYEYRVFRKMKRDGIRRGLSMFLTVVTALLIVALVILMIVPQLINSVKRLTDGWEMYLDMLLASVQVVLNKFTENLPIEVNIGSTSRVVALIEDTYGSVADWWNIELKPRFDQLINIDVAFGSAKAMMSFVTDTILSCFVAGYILASKEKRRAQIAKIRKALLSPEQDRKLIHFVKLVNKSFGGFIFGSIVDSVLVGIVTYIILSIFNISPYNLLIATFVGITNIIPFFGPFIGAIPSFFIVLISSPTKAFWFLVIILVIQQIDGNIICPKILGENTGISSLAVLISITICGALWGMVGMVIGVPVFAVIIELIKQYLEKRLRLQGLPTDTTEYYAKDALGNAEQDVYYEHSSLRYKYEHGTLKPKVDRMVESVKRKCKKKPKEVAVQADEPMQTLSDTDAPAD